MVAIKLFNSTNIQKLDWPDGSLYEYHYISSFLEQGPAHFISNIQTDLHLLQAGSHFFPVTVNHTEYQNAYTCSPYSGYISYARKELSKLKNPLIEKSLSLLLDTLDPILKNGEINKVVGINNWLISTNLYPKWEGKEANRLTQFLLDKFPDHCLMFRSLNEHSNASLINALKKTGYLLIPSREVFLFDQKVKKYRRKRNTVNDWKLLKNTPYQIVSHSEITENDYSRIVELYRLLYFKKHLSCSPLFTENFISLCHQKNLLSMTGVRNQQGTLEGIVGWFVRDGTMATPLVGYNTSLPREKALFRLITILAIKEAFETNTIFNISAGVAQFKKWRGAVGFTEYSAVYVQHLPFKRQLVWKILSFLMSKIGLPILRHYRF